MEKILKVEVSVVTFIPVPEEYDMEETYPLVRKALSLGLENKAGIQYVIREQPLTPKLPHIESASD